MSGTTGGGGGDYGRGMGGPGRGGRIFDDLAGVAGGAFSVLSGLRDEAEAAMRARAEEMIQRLELVRREELDAAMELARRAREEAESLAARVAALEARLATMPTGSAAAGSGEAARGPDDAVGASAGDPRALPPEGGPDEPPAAVPGRSEAGGGGSEGDSATLPPGGRDPAVRPGPEI